MDRGRILDRSEADTLSEVGRLCHESVGVRGPELAAAFPSASNGDSFSFVAEDEDAKEADEEGPIESRVSAEAGLPAWLLERDAGLWGDDAGFSTSDDCELL